MAMLRLGMIGFDWYPYNTRDIRFVRAAVDAGYVVDVICLRRPHEKGYEVDNGVSIYRIPMDRRYGLHYRSLFFTGAGFFYWQGQP